MPFGFHQEGGESIGFGLSRKGKSEKSLGGFFLTGRKEIVLSILDVRQEPSLSIHEEGNGAAKHFTLTTGRNADHECSRVFGPGHAITVNLVGTAPRLTLKGDGFTIRRIIGKGGTVVAKGRGVRVLQCSERVTLCGMASR